MHALLDRALAAARQLRASDIHLKAGLAPVLRIDGDLRTLSDVPPLSREFLQTLALSLLNDRRRELLDRTGDVSMSLTAPDGSRQRLQVSQYRGGIAIALRLVPAQVPTLDKLGLPEAVRALVAPGSGLVLVAGPAGAGKTTTLAALANEINGERACHIISLEDPVEITLPDRRSVVIQREIGLDAPTMSAALRAMLRQDADIIVVGELRDPDALELALSAAETGRLVLIGVGAGDATSVVDRLAETGGAERPGTRGRIARALRGAVAQRLLRRSDGRGRVAAVELLLCDDETRAALAVPANVGAVRAALTAGHPAGSQSLDAAVIALARARRISGPDARAHAVDVAAVTAALELDAEAPTGRAAASDESVQAAVEDDARPD